MQTLSPCLLGAVPQFLIVEEGSDKLNFSPLLTRDRQEGPSLTQAVLIGVRMGVQYKAEQHTQVLNGQTDSKTGSR